MITPEPHEGVINETPAQVVVRLLRQGGHALVVGGGVSDLPDKYRGNPQIILWDDRQQGLNSKEVPANTKAILYNRFLSHKTAIKLRKAAEKMRIPVFAMLEPRKIRELLAEVMQEETAVTSTPTPEEEDPIELVEAAADVSTEEHREQSALLMKEDVFRKAERGEMGIILAKLLRNDETPSAGARRLMPIIKAEYHIAMNELALLQAIRTYRIKQEQLKAAAKQPTNGAVHTPLASSTPLTATSSSSDDFVEAERLLNDALAAISLSLDFVQNLKRKHTSIANREKKLREFLLTEEE